MEFDYFYGPEDAEQYQFYRIPKLLITSEQFILNLSVSRHHNCLQIDAVEFVEE